MGAVTFGHLTFPQLLFKLREGMSEPTQRDLDYSVKMAARLLKPMRS